MPGTYEYNGQLYTTASTTEHCKQPYTAEQLKTVDNPTWMDN